MRRKVFLNSFIGFFSQLIVITMGLIVPRIVMTHYGSDINGLTNTVSQIFTYMALLEAGIGQAAQNALYKYINDNDQENVSKVMATARRYYRRISKIYAIAVVVLAVVIPLVLKTDVPHETIAVYILFEGLTALVSFYYTSLWIVFLNASGKSYITNIFALLNRILLYTVKIILYLYNVNIAYIQIGYFIVSLVQLVLYAYYMKRHYSWIDYSVCNENERLPDRNSYVITEVAWTVFSSTDMIILSVFVSTSLSSVYSTYNMIFVALETLLNGCYNSIKYILGQNYHKSADLYQRTHDVFNSVFIGCSVILLSVCYWTTIPFIRLYTQGVNDINYIMPLLPLGFCLIKLLSRSRTVAGNLSGIAGYAKQVSLVSLIEAGINIVLSLVFVNFYGIYGVLFATVIALPVKVIYVNYIADKLIMKRKAHSTILIMGTNYSIFGITVLLQSLLPISIASYGEFIKYSILLLMVYTLIVILGNMLVNASLRQETLKLIKGRWR